MIWIVYFINLMLANENPLIGRWVNMELSEVDYPAITICSEQTTKYAFAEQLGNYLDPNESHPYLLSKLQNKFFEKALERYAGYLYTYERQCKTKNDNRVDKTCEVSAISVHSISKVKISNNKNIAVCCIFV